MRTRVEYPYDTPPSLPAPRGVAGPLFLTRRSSIGSESKGVAFCLSHPKDPTTSRLRTQPQRSSTLGILTNQVVAQVIVMESSKKDGIRDTDADAYADAGPGPGVSSPDVDPRDLAPADDDVQTLKEKKLTRKLDTHLIPLVMALYLFSFLDRVNIGNARLYNLEQDLGLQGNQFQVAVSILFVTYIIFEVPSNLVLKLFTPSRWIAFITVSWGIIATLTGLVESYGSLIACRLLLGAVEAGLFPGLNVYLTFFYSKHELALRVGYLFVSAAIAGGLGGLLAFGIGHMEGVAGLSGWRWIMIIEGLPTVVLGVVAYFALPNDVESAYFLTEEEKAIMVSRRGREYGNTTSAQEFSREDMWKAFKDWKVWLFSVAQFGVDTMLYGFSTFLPTIINGLGSWTTAQVQLLTVPCYFVAAVVYLSMAFLSDRSQRRGLFCVVFGSLSVIGYGVLISNTSSGVHYFGCFLVAAGLYVVVGLPLAWLPNNTPRYGKRTTANGMQLTIGNCSGVMSAFIYQAVDKPRYIRGHAVTLSMVGMATCMYGFLWFWYARENKKREAGHLEDKYRDMSDDELAELGDESPRFRYTI
ncbi:putative transporter [Colletotrichum orbiculare MAFF 240422]|uniref:Transporter n=1 Tax=Colletotrichum orbiculare (strain 104-T / ATCC 96160 / CBS 514.97 / LARS 414 / MAFF 240422) TaxID=1213857 RepID=A0A484FCE9_COLOR|nr:putative transporter [Colletotrichum orbiculare MAFF 240422]